MKMAPIIKSLEGSGKDVVIVHTGQHYDKSMSENIIKNLDIKEPDYHLGEMKGSHAEQTAKIMVGFEAICNSESPEIVIVAGDVNSTVACALVAAKMHIKTAHVESGLRSFDKTMPEEINRIVTDHISDFLFTTEISANFNLKNEGISDNKVFFVGNCMIDSLLEYISVAKESTPWKKYGFSGKDYILMTLHRPSNVDFKNKLKAILDMVSKVSENIPVLFSAHPRTANNIKKFDLKISKTVKVISPRGYTDFLGLAYNAKLVLTDSGGIQEETTVLGVPCVTLRTNTERPITIDKGTNILAGTNPDNIFSIINKILKGDVKNGLIPELWDGKAANRISDILKSILS